MGIFGSFILVSLKKLDAFLLTFYKQQSRGILSFSYTCLGLGIILYYFYFQELLYSLQLKYWLCDPCWFTKVYLWHSQAIDKNLICLSQLLSSFIQNYLGLDLTTLQSFQLRLLRVVWLLQRLIWLLLLIRFLISVQVQLFHQEMSIIYLCLLILILQLGILVLLYLFSIYYRFDTSFMLSICQFSTEIRWSCSYGLPPVSYSYDLQNGSYCPYSIAYYFLFYYQLYFLVLDFLWVCFCYYNIIINSAYYLLLQQKHCVFYNQQIWSDMLAVQYIQKGVVYKIRNRKTHFYLTSGTEVTSTPVQQAKLSQLWVLDQVKPNIYELVSLQSGQVITRKQNLTIQKGVWSANQFWKLQRAEMNANQNYFWIIANDDQSQYLFGSSASEKVSMKNYDNTLFVSNWEVQEVDLQRDLCGCCVFKSHLSNMAIDVPEGSNKQGVAVIQYTFNGRGNQRWVIQKTADGFVFRNLCSSLILCPQGRSTKIGTKIVQTQLTNKLQQKWIIQHIRQNQFVIKNRADPSACLGASSMKQSASIQLVNEKQKAIWILQGSLSILSQ